jgi:hypothetical protein
MKTIELATAVPSLPELLDLASEDNVILRTADGREYLLAEVDEFEREVALVRQNQELMELLDRRSQPGKTYTLEETRKILGID